MILNIFYNTQRSSIKARRKLIANEKFPGVEKNCHEASSDKSIFLHLRHPLSFLERKQDLIKTIREVFFIDFIRSRLEDKKWEFIRKFDYFSFYWLCWNYILMKLLTFLPFVYRKKFYFNDLHLNDTRADRNIHKGNQGDGWRPTVRINDRKNFRREPFCFIFREPRSKIRHQGFHPFAFGPRFPTDPLIGGIQFKLGEN